MYQFPFVYHRTIRLQDTDAAGVVYFAQVLSICHEAYEAALAAAGIDLREFLGGTVAMPIVHADVNFLKPMICGEQYAVYLAPTLVTEAKFQLSYTLFAVNAPNQPSAQASTVHVCINSRTRARVPLPAAIEYWLTEQSRTAD